MTTHMCPQQQQLDTPRFDTIGSVLEIRNILKSTFPYLTFHRVVKHDEMIC